VGDKPLAAQPTESLWELGAGVYAALDRGVYEAVERLTNAFPAIAGQACEDSFCELDEFNMMLWMHIVGTNASD